MENVQKIHVFVMMDIMVQIVVVILNVLMEVFVMEVYVSVQMDILEVDVSIKSVIIIVVQKDYAQMVNVIVKKDILVNIVKHLHV